jgi:hypothetical protein
VCKKLQKQRNFNVYQSDNFLIEVVSGGTWCHVVSRGVTHFLGQLLSIRNLWRGIDWEIREYCEVLQET